MSESYLRKSSVRPWLAFLGATLAIPLFQIVLEAYSGVRYGRGYLWRLSRYPGEVADTLRFDPSTILELYLAILPFGLGGAALIGLPLILLIRRRNLPSLLAGLRLAILVLLTTLFAVGFVGTHLLDADASYRVPAELYSWLSVSGAAGTFALVFSVLGGWSDTGAGKLTRAESVD